MSSSRTFALRAAVLGRRVILLVLDLQSTGASRRDAEAFAGEEPDDGTRIQAGTDADAHTTAGRLQSQLTVAQWLTRLLQRSARASGWRHPYRQGQHQRHRGISGSDTADAQHHGRLQHHQFYRRQHHRQSGEGSVAGLGPCRRRQHADAGQRHDQPPGSIAHQCRRRRHPGVAERQFGDRGQAGDPAQL